MSALYLENSSSLRKMGVIAMHVELGDRAENRGFLSLKFFLILHIGEVNASISFALAQAISIPT